MMRNIKYLAVIFAVVTCLPVHLCANTDSDEQLRAIDKSIRFREYNEAIKLLNPLVKSGNAEAQFRMAAIYRSGTGVKKNLEQAMALYEKAATSGHAEAQYTIASLLYKRGKIRQAEYWYQLASTQGHLKAAEKLVSIRDEAEAGETTDIKPDQVFSSIRHNDVGRIKQLLKSNYHFAIYDDKSRTPLMAALLAAHQEIAELLLPVTAQLDHIDKNNNRAIHFAATNGYTDIVEQLLKKGVNINAQDGLGNTALIIAIRHDDAKLVRLLLSYKASYTIKNKKRKTALDLARARQHRAILNVFNQQGITVPQKQTSLAKVDINSFRQSIKQSSSIYRGWPMLSIASLLGEKEIAAQLLSQGADINARDKNGYTALHRASSKGQYDTVRLLLSSGALVNAVSNRNETPLVLAAQTGGLKTVNLLIKNGADTSILTSAEDSALALSISNRHPAIALALADKKLDKESIHLALLLSIQFGMQDVSLKLIPRDRLINKLDKNKRSVLWHSTDLGMEKTAAALLLNKSVKLDQKDINGYSPLSRAVLKGYRKIAVIMIGKGASLKTLTAENNTLLMLSVISGNKELLKMLSEKDIDINAKNNVGDTALMLAAAAGNNDMVELLITAGANIQTRNQDELNAYQVALNSGHKETAELIRKHSGRLFKLFN